jgi:hypothetical protein
MTESENLLHAEIARLQSQSKADREAREKAETKVKHLEHQAKARDLHIGEEIG